MTSLGTITYKGKSGKSYNFTIYNFNSSWNSVAGVYIVTRRYQNGQNGYTHSTLYIGQTDNLKERFNNHHKQNCFVQNNANCLCFIEVTQETARLEIESDLLSNNSTTCNG